MTCAKTQRRKENQGHNLGALSRVKTFCVFPRSGKLALSPFLAPLRLCARTDFGFACFNIQSTLALHTCRFRIASPFQGQPRPGPLGQDSLLQVVLFQFRVKRAPTGPQDFNGLGSVFGVLQDLLEYLFFRTLNCSGE